MDRTVVEDTRADNQEWKHRFSVDKPSWTEQVGAGFTKFRSQGLTTSQMNYTQDAFTQQLDDMSTKHPEQADIFERMKALSGRNLKLYESEYEAGTLKDFYTGAGASISDVQTYFDLVKSEGRNRYQTLESIGAGVAASDYYTAEQVLEAGDSWTADVVGTMGGALTDPLTIATLPMGGFVARGAGSILGTAGKAAMQEMGIATVTELPIQAQTMNWSEKMGVDYTIKEAATNAVLSVGAAGLIRGAGSGLYDLTKTGVKVLEDVNPELAEDYVNLTRNNVSSSVGEHIKNLTRTDIGDQPVVKDGDPFDGQPPVKEFDNNKFIEPELIDYEGELKVVVGEDINGEPITTTYKEMSEALDAELTRLQQIEDCIL